MDRKMKRQRDTGKTTCDNCGSELIQCSECTTWFCPKHKNHTCCCDKCRVRKCRRKKAAG